MISFQFSICIIRSLRGGCTLTPFHSSSRVRAGRHCALFWRVVFSRVSAADVPPQAVLIDVHGLRLPVWSYSDKSFSFSFFFEFVICTSLQSCVRRGLTVYYLYPPIPLSAVPIDSKIIAVNVFIASFQYTSRIQ